MSYAAPQGPVAPAIDVRSDTVTHPTPAMRSAMAEAPVGDDVFGDDPTILALEGRAAALLGKEAALFVPSGTMGNLVSLMAHVPRGGEVISPSESHIFNDEAANYAVVVGAGLRPIAETPDGEMPIEAVLDAIQDSSDPHCPITSLVVVENCHAHTMSRPIAPDYVARLRAALPPGLPIHVDGARLFNAAVALDLPVAELVRDADSVTFCLSKGLCAPVGSVVVGSADFIWRARRARKLLKHPEIQEVHLIEPVYEKASSIFRDSMRAYAERNTELAVSLYTRDLDLDEIHRDVIRELGKRLDQSSGQVKQILHLIFMVRSLERVGDLAVNIGEDAVFLINAEDIRHLGAKRAAKRQVAEENSALEDLD